VARDVVVGWLQHDYGQLGRPAEAIAHVLASGDLAGRVAYVEPFKPGLDGAEPELEHAVDRDLHVFRGRGNAPVLKHEIAATVIGAAGLTDPVLLNFGVSEVNWWLHYELAPACSSTVLVAYDKLSQWSAVGARAAQLDRVRGRLLTASDVVCGMSEGSIDDVPGAHYVGHGVDAAWDEPDIDATPEPADLAEIPHPRAVYVGALSMRFDLDAVAALARAGLHVVLVGIAPPPALLELAANEPNVHFLGARPPAQTPGYLLHSDVGIVPHTDEPFTRSMEPHKAYNYAAAGLRTVTLHTAHAPALDAWVTATTEHDAFVAAALAATRLGPDEIAAARALSWERVAAAIMAAAR
jgi:glycosyltransferase involved in cell wall biosynthesis